MKKSIYEMTPDELENCIRYNFYIIHDLYNTGPAVFGYFDDGWDCGYWELVCNEITQLEKITNEERNDLWNKLHYIVDDEEYFRDEDDDEY